jgi:hypothetical protein
MRRLLVVAVLFMLGVCSGAGSATGYDYGFGPRIVPLHNSPTNPGTGLATRVKLKD